MDITVIPREIEDAEPAQGPPTSDKAERILGLLVLLGAFGGFGVWAALAPLDSAAVAPGVFAVESSRKTIAHLEGGIVSDILVREGQRVAAGEVLLRLDSTQARAQLEIIRSQYLARRAQEARLVSELEERPSVEYPEDLLAAQDDLRVQEAITGERRLFEARRQALEGEEQVLKQRLGQLEEQIHGREALAASKTRRITLYQEEIDGLHALFAKGLGDKSRLRESERLLAEVDGERGEHQSAVTEARIKIGETRLQIAQLRRQFTSEVVTDLRDAQTRLMDLRERVRALDNTLERTVIRAPVAGSVVELSVHTLGGVVRPGEHLLDLIPDGEPLVIEARVSLNDIDRVSPGLEARIRLTAFNSRTTPEVMGRVLTVSADRLTDPTTRMPYYLARIQVSPEGVEALEGRELQPGMSAEALISTGRRTFFDYLIRPVTDRVAHAFNED